MSGSCTKAPPLHLRRQVHLSVVYALLPLPYRGAVQRERAQRDYSLYSLNPKDNRGPPKTTTPIYKLEFPWGAAASTNPFTFRGAASSGLLAPWEAAPFKPLAPWELRFQILVLG